jgi:hypothetical protein
MRSPRPLRLLLVLLVPVIAAIEVACTLTTPLEGYEGVAVSAGEAGPDAGLADAQGDAASAVASCDALKRASPGTPDGVQLIDPDGPGPVQPFRAYCDMTNDDGGWMLVTAAMLGAETTEQATVTRLADDHGGLVMRVFVNSSGCSGPAPTRHRIFIGESLAWSRIRLKQTFAGNASCWDIFGGMNNTGPVPPLDPNLFAFDTTHDVMRDAVRMGGSLSNAFDGDTNRCDNQMQNFWHTSNGEAPRSATVILRRHVLGAPGGLATGAGCGGYGPGETSDTWWEYRDVYVK